MEAIIVCEKEPKALTELTKGRLRAEIPELRRTPNGWIRARHRFLLHLHTEHINDLNSEIENLYVEINRLMPPLDEDEKRNCLDAIPHVNLEFTQVIDSESLSVLSLVFSDSFLQEFDYAPLSNSLI